MARALVPRYEDEQAEHTARWSLILGAVFPDIDVAANPFDPDHFGTIRIHRSVTHSLVCLPVWAVLFAVLAGWYCRRRGIVVPQRWMLGVLFGLGIGLHILFDCITSFGTMVWSPISWTRVEWDWTFIIDLALTGVLLFFLLLSWVAAGAERRRSRAVWMLGVMAALAGLYALASYALERSVPVWELAGVVGLSALPLVVTLAGRGLPLSAKNWCRMGLLASFAYLGIDAWAHGRALERVREYAAAAQLQVTDVAAIPLPPNLTQWQGFARTAGSVHQWTISLENPPGLLRAASVVPAVSAEPCPPVLWTIPQVRAWMRFARIPVVACGQAVGGESAEFTDLRFERPALRRERGGGGHRPIPFTWRVTFSDRGRVITEGWVIE